MKSKSLNLTIFIFLLTLLGCSSSPYKNSPVFDTPETRAVAANWLNTALIEGAQKDKMKRFRAFGISQISVDEVRMEWNDVQQRGRNNYQVLKRELAFSTITLVSRPRYDGDFWAIFVDASGGGITFHFKDNQNAASAEAALRRLMKPFTAAETLLAGRKLCRNLDRRGNLSADWAEASLQVLTGQDFGQNAEDWRVWLDRLQIGS